MITITPRLCVWAVHRLQLYRQHLALYILCDMLILWRMTVLKAQYPMGALRKTLKVILVRLSIIPKAQGLRPSVFCRAFPRAPLRRLFHLRVKSLRHAHGSRPATARLRSECLGHRHCSCRIPMHQSLWIRQQVRSHHDRKRSMKLCRRTRTCSTPRLPPVLQADILCHFSVCWP